MLDNLEKRINAVPRVVTILVTHLVFYGLYVLTSRHQLFAPRILPLLPHESSIPCVGWTSYVYLSLFLEIPLAMLLMPKEGFGRAVGTGLGIVAFHVAIFVLFPTAYPRPAGPSGHAIVDLIWTADRPTNAFPSLHVAMSFYVAFAFGRMGRYAAGAALFVWAIMIAVSTMTVKQHYALDGLAALALLASRSIKPFREQAAR